MTILLLALAQDFSFAPPDAAFLASLNVKQVRGAIEGLVREAGIESPVSWKVLDRVDRVQVAIAMRNDEPQMTALLEGTFKASDVAELKKGVSGKDSLKIEMLDEKRILIADQGLLKNLPRPPKGKLMLTPRAAPEPKPQFAVVHGMTGGTLRVPLE
jgi:hypothetical protein